MRQVWRRRDKVVDEDGFENDDLGFQVDEDPEDRSPDLVGAPGLQDGLMRVIKATMKNRISFIVMIKEVSV